jgi:hypothetical protein
MVTRWIELSLWFIKDIDTLKLKRKVRHQLVSRFKFPNVGIVNQPNGTGARNELLEIVTASFVDKRQV